MFKKLLYILLFSTALLAQSKYYLSNADAGSGNGSSFANATIGNWAAWQGYGYDAHSGKATSLFTFINQPSETPTDYRLLSGSSGIDEGTNLSTYFTTDYSGHTRPEGTTWDAGAFEFIPSGGLDITGSGTSEDPYILYNAADVDSIRYLGLDKYYELGSDIDMSSYTSWVPLGDGLTAFTGQLDGKNHTIRYFSPTISTTTTAYLGLFGVVETSLAFRNIIIDSSNVSTSTGYWGSGAAIGILIGRINNVKDTLYNITVKNSTLLVQGQSGSSGRFNCGILIGITYNSGRYMSRCRVSNSSLIFKGTHTNYTGYAGILVGYNRFNVQQCYIENSTIITTENASFIGGFTGYSNQPIANCYVKDITMYDSSATGAYKALFTALHGSSNDAEQYCYTVGQFGGSVEGVRSSFIYAIPSDPDMSSDFADTTISNVSVTSVSAITIKPQGKTTAEMKVPSLYTGKSWNFTTIWGIDTLGLINDGYPYLINYHPPAQFVFLSPTLGSQYILDQTIPVQFTVSGTDTVQLLYTLDGGSSWSILEDTLAISNDTTLYSWSDLPTFGASITNIVLQVRDFSDTTNYALSSAFTILSESDIEILYPIDGTASKNLGDTLNISIKTVLVNSLNLWYAVGDTTTWIPIAMDIEVDDPIADTTVYSWTLPNIYGTIWLKASQVSDTTLYTFNQTVRYIGRNIASYPSVCWFGPYSNNYFGYELSFPSYAATPVAYSWYVDPSCGWASGVQYALTMMISPDATSMIAYNSGRMAYWDFQAYMPYSVALYLGGDTTWYKIPEIFSNYGSEVTYRQRTYYYDSTTQCIRCDDLKNGIDSIFVADLSGTIAGAYVLADNPNIIFQVYNVYWGNLADKVIPATINLESLNPLEFKAQLLIQASTTTGRGRAIFAIDALSTPSMANPASDTVRLLTSLTLRRDYFRGIDPKARKKGR